MVWHGAGMPRVLETGGEMFQWKISVFEDVGNEGVSYVDTLLSLLNRDVWRMRIG